MSCESITDEFKHSMKQKGEFPGFIEEWKTHRSLRQKIQFIWTLVAVHPIAFLFTFGYMISNVTAQAITLDKVCFEMYDSKDCSEHEDEVQKMTAYWNIALNAAAIISATPGILLWSAWANKTGEIRFVIMICFAGFAILGLILTIEAGCAAAPLWLMVIVNFIGGLSGLFGQMFNLIFTLISISVLNKKYLVVHFAIVNTVVYLGFAIGAFIATALVKRLSNASNQAVAMSFLVLGIIYSWIVLPSPKRVFQLIAMGAKKDSGNVHVPKQDLAKDASIFTTTKQLIVDAARTFTKPRLGRARFHILMTLISYLLSNTSDLGLSTTQNDFMYHPPLNFTTATYSTYNGVSSGVQLVGTLVIVSLLKVLQCSDSLILIFSICSNLLRLAILCFSKTQWMIYLAAIVGVIAQLNVSTTASFIVKLTSSDEQIVIIAGTGLVANIASLISVILYNYTYSATVAWFPGLAFGLGAILTFISLILQLIVHVSWTLEQRKNSVNDRHDTPNAIDKY